MLNGRRFSERAVLMLLILIGHNTEGSSQSVNEQTFKAVKDATGNTLCAVGLQPDACDISWQISSSYTAMSTQLYYYIVCVEFLITHKRRVTCLGTLQPDISQVVHSRSQCGSLCNHNKSCQGFNYYNKPQPVCDMFGSDQTPLGNLTSVANCSYYKVC
jgi:hypothetical protein